MRVPRVLQGRLQSLPQLVSLSEGLGGTAPKTELDVF
jgi:hypothetical protein